MRLNKNIKIFINYFLGPLLFIWLSWSIYKNIRTQPNLGLSWQYIKQSFQGPLVWNLVLVIFLMFVNWGIESWKWKLAVKKCSLYLLKSIPAILSGVFRKYAQPHG